MKRGSNIVGVGAYNERLVLSLISRAGALSKAELTKRTGLSKQALTDVVGRLEEEGKLTRGQPQRGRVGQPQVPFSLNPQGAYAVGLKVGRRSFDLVLMNFTGEVEHSFRSVCNFPTPAKLTRFFDDAWRTLMAETPAAIRRKISGIGIAIPSEIWRWAEEIDVPGEYMEQWKTFDVADHVRAISGLECQSMNDITSACVGELMFGGTGEISDFLYFYIGAFVGGGLVMNDTVVYGRNLNAAAFGSMLIGGASEAEPSPHQLLATASIVRLQHELESAGIDASPLWEYRNEWPGFDDILHRWIDAAALHLAIAGINASAVVDVQTLVIDGSIPAHARHMLVERVGDALTRLPTAGLAPLRVMAGTLGHDARAIGAAAIPLYSNFSFSPAALLK